MEIIKIEDLSFQYPTAEHKALDGVNLTIHSGEFIVICGESGCGKTTLLRLLKRELAPHGKIEGKIFFRQMEQKNLDDRTAAKAIGYVMQNPEHQIVTDKVWHELAFGLENIGCPKEVIRRRVGEMASYFGIGEWFRRNTNELSGGQKQLLNLASVLAMQPEVLILDEPTSQLDPIAASDFLATLWKLNRELGLTILLAEHRLEEVYSMADKAAVMERGKILLYDTPKQVGTRLKNEFRDHPMCLAMPSAFRIYNGVLADGICPLTVREGSEFLRSHFNNQIRQPDYHRTENQTKSQETVLELKKVCFRYRRDLPDVLENVGLQVYKGEIVCILGENGSGKTTLLHTITGQNKIYRGKISIFGKKLKEYTGKTLFRKNLALLPQDPQTVFLKSTVYEDYKEIMKPMGYSEKEMQEEIKNVVELLDIADLLNQHPYDLSGGEQQKAAFGKILLLQPRLLLMDEPTKGLDAFFKKNLEEIFRVLKNRGMTLVLVTHDVEFAAGISDRCCLFFDKEIISSDVPERFFSDNTFYTTAANRISRNYYDGAITCQQVIELCLKNSE